VRADLRSAVLDACPDAEPLFEKTDAEHWQYDHIGFVRQRLAAAGIEEARIDDVGGNTLAEPEAFFSYRGAQRRGEAQFGHNVSAIASGASPRH
jgi:copper oxidase (laccase) domain-containing protein